MTAQPREILIYVNQTGKSPFEDWLISLRDNKTRTIIKARIKRLEFGNLGNYRSVGEGVYELKINYGPGLRIYFGQIG